MRAVIFHGGRDIRVEELPLPEVREGDVLIAVRAAGICGSDLHRYRGYDPWSTGGPPPQRCGHEFSGVVSAIGAAVEGLEIGQRAAVEPMQLAYCGGCPQCLRGDTNLCSERGKKLARRSSAGFSEFDLAAAPHVYPIPPHVSFSAAALADVYACAVHALHRVPVRAGQTAAIFGTGPIALALGQAVRQAGAKAVVAGRRDAALEFALRVGAADAMMNLDRDPAVSECADIAFEAVGGPSSDALRHAVTVVARGGTIGILGAFAGEMQIPYREANRKEIGLQMCNGYSTWDGRREFQIALDGIAAAPAAAEALITHRFPLECISTAFETAADKARSNAVKVIVESHA